MAESTEPAMEAASDAQTDAAGGAHVPGHHAIGCPECFEELQRNQFWWKARPDGSRLVGLVVARDDMPPVYDQRMDLARFGVDILDFRYPAPETEENWEQRLGRLFDTLQPGDVLVVANERALGRQPDEVTRTIRALAKHGLVVKVVNHGASHLEDAQV